MEYNKRDLFSDYVSTYSEIDTIQEYRYKEGEWDFKYKKASSKVTDLEKDILNINKTYRTNKNDYSPYLKHKSYPSARSYYPQKIWYSLGKGRFTIYDDNECCYKVYENKELIDIKKGSVILSTNDIMMEHYKSIHNSLICLEFGHIIYNIERICLLYNCRININSKKFNDYILININDNEKYDSVNIEKLEELYANRSSGSYTKKLINIKGDYNNYNFIPDSDVTEQFYKIFGYKLDGIVDRIIFQNNGSCYSSNKYISEFIDLNAQYHFIDFRTASQYTLFLIKRNLKKDNLIDYILFIGYLAQEICLENSKESVFNRPVKQVDPFFWQEVIGINLKIKEIINNLLFIILVVFILIEYEYYKFPNEDRQKIIDRLMLNERKKKAIKKSVFSILQAVKLLMFPIALVQTYLLRSYILNLLFDKNLKKGYDTISVVLSYFSKSYLLIFIILLLPVFLENFKILKMIEKYIRENGDDELSHMKNKRNYSRIIGYNRRKNNSYRMFFEKIRNRK